MKRILFPLLFSAYLFAKEIPPIVVDLRNPTFKNGVLYTTEGGVVKSQDLRIQARSIQYIHRTEKGEAVHRLEAEGDLLVQYKGHVYVGTEFEYDFLSQSGTVYNGKTFASMWYIGGEEIALLPDGNYRIHQASFTTCENQKSTWELKAAQVDVIKHDLLEAKNVRLRVFEVPTLWLPTFKVNLNKFHEPVLRYLFDWDKGQGPKAGFRVQLYSWKDFALFGRLEYRLRTGWGGALETEYFPEHKRTTFVTRNYLGTDRLENAPDKMRRYRLQGELHSQSESGHTQTTLTWDKYSDVRMPDDFRSDDFEVNPGKKTILTVHHQADSLAAALKVRPRFNVFESIRQDLPTLSTHFKPIEIGATGIFSTTSAKASYLDFVYSNQLSSPIPSFHAARLELKEKIYRPFPVGPLTLTPEIGGTGIFYSNSPSHKSKTLGILYYGAKAHLRGYRQFDTYKHVLEPYAQYMAFSKPTVAPSEHYIFSIQDGYDQLQQVKVGVRNLLFPLQKEKKEARFAIDLYANAFFKDPVIPQMIPRLYLQFDWNLPSLQLSVENAWNFQNQVLDHSKALCRWTISEDIAFSLEGRYRSRYTWRKADPENFVLDVTRSQDELLLSPLSDRRITFLTNFFFRLTPFWECHIQSHHGFYRLNEKPYNEVKVDLFTWITSAWKLQLTYSHTIKDDRVSAGLTLVKK